MLVLCINTGTLESNLCLVDNDKILSSASWGDFAKEAEMLVPSLNKILEDSGVKLAQLEGVFVINGPGSFSAIRVGIVIANTFAQNLGLPLYSMSTFDLMNNMYAGYDYIVLNGGGDTLLVHDKKSVKSMKVSEFNLNKGFLAADLTDNQLKLLDKKFELLNKSLNFDEVCARISSEEGFEKFQVKNLPLLPYYVKNPSIS